MPVAPRTDTSRTIGSDLTSPTTPVGTEGPATTQAEPLAPADPWGVACHVPPTRRLKLEGGAAQGSHMPECPGGTGQPTGPLAVYHRHLTPPTGRSSAAQARAVAR